MLKFKDLQRNRTLKYGIPMLLFMVGGSFGLREFTQIRYDARKVTGKRDPALATLVKERDQSVVVDEEYEKLKEVSIDNWKNIRGPRPWENSKEYQEQQRVSQS